MNIFAIVVTYNGEKWVKKCLDSLQNSTISLTTIVVDNKSTDQTISIIENEFRDVKIIVPEKNLGFGKGNNIGLRNAIAENADYVFLLNQDAWIAPDTIEKLINCHKKYPEYGILSPFHKSYDSNEIEYYFSTIINPRDCEGLINDMYFNNFKEVYPIRFVHAAAWLISKECLNTVGAFDPIFPHYGEDEDYVTRTQYHKFKVGVVSNSIVHHYGTNDGLTKMEFNFQLHFNRVLNHLKNNNHKFSGLLLVYLKGAIDKLTSALLYRRFKDFTFQSRLLLKTLVSLNKIIKCRNLTKNKGAYL